MPAAAIFRKAAVLVIKMSPGSLSIWKQSVTGACNIMEGGHLQWKGEGSLWEFLPCASDRAEGLWVCRMGVQALHTCIGQGGSPLSSLLVYALWLPHGRDGVPPYRLRKQHRREMQESAKANGRVPLPHIPVRGRECFGGVACFQGSSFPGV